MESKMASEQELAEMERMSNDYVPDVQGPLVGQQQSTQALIREYANADSVYVHKTKALPAKFSHYRTVRGDGNCGWRALAFGYFETLLRLNNVSKVQAELARLRACNDTMLAKSGFDLSVCEDFYDETFGLLQDLVMKLPNHDGGRSILAAFNDPSTSAAITYHFRLLTSAWMKMNPAIYADFLEGIDVNSYVLQHIEPPQIELDHIGLQCLAASVINAAGIAIDVLYLDRSEGEEVNTHQLPVLDGGGPVIGTPTIRLLYRPGHYDLLYKSEDVTDMAIGMLANPEVRLQADPIYDQIEPIFQHTEELPEYLLDLPGFGSCVRVTKFSSEPYQGAQGTSAVPEMLSPTMDIRTTLAKTSLSPVRKEEPSPPPLRDSSSPPPMGKGGMENPFRATRLQNKYDLHFARLLAEQEKAGFTNDTTSKREDPAHYGNNRFQPQIYSPGSDNENSP